MVLNRRSLWCLALSALWAVSLSGCQEKPGAGPGASGTAGSSTGGKRIVLLINGDSPFWDAARAGMNEAKSELKLETAGLNAIMEVNDGTVAGQISKLRQIGSQVDVAGLGLSAIDAENASVVAELKKLTAKGIPVVTFDSDLSRTKYRDVRTAFIGTDNYQGGKELGQCAAQLLPEGGEYATFVGLLSAQNAKERISGFAAGAGEKFKSADSMADDFDRTRAKQNVRNALSNHPDIKAVVGIYSYNAPAIVDVVKELGKRDALKVLVFDAEPIAINQMSQGQIDAMLVQNPYQMGYQSVKLLKALIEKDEAVQKEMLPDLGQDKEKGDIFDTGLKVVVPAEGSTIQKDGFGPRTEFLTFPEFKDWLKKYNLTGS